MQLKSKHLWSDERIQKRYDELNAIAPGYPDLNMRDVAREIWSDYEKCVTELEAVVTTLRDMLKTERASFRSLSDDRARWRNMFSEAYSENARLREENAGLQSWCQAVEERLQADVDQQKEDMAEIDRLRSLLPSAEVRDGIRKLWNLQSGQPILSRIVVGEWLNRLESESGE